MPALARWNLRHKRLVVGFWMAAHDRRLRSDRPRREVTLTAVQRSRPRRLRDESADRRHLRQRRRRRPARARCSAAERDDGRFPGRPSSELAGALARVKAALPASRIASYASTGDRAFVSPTADDLRARLHPGTRRRRPRPAGGAARRRRRSQVSPSAAHRCASPGSTHFARPETTPVAREQACCSGRCSPRWARCSCSPSSSVPSPHSFRCSWRSSRSRRRSS